MKNGKYFIGIDLGWKEKKTTGICLLKEKEIVFLKDVFGRDLFSLINPYLKETKTIAIDAPLTKGKGRGKMRLYEKFLSTKIFRKEKANPIPPALMPKLCHFARELVGKLERNGFILDLNLIEVFPTLIKKLINYSQILKILTYPTLFSSSKRRGSRLRRPKPRVLPYQTENQEMALICALMAFWHSQFKTRWLGYKDGFLFLPQLSLWKKSWQKKFKKAWQERSRLKYQHLLTNIFE